MSILMTESELRRHCNAAGQTCKDMEVGCTCAAGQLVGIGLHMRSPTDWGELDSPKPKPTDTWLAWVFMGAFAALVLSIYLLTEYGPEAIEMLVEFARGALE